jgi:polyferredoxin
MGIDIRDGQQLACITCGLCIDACDEIMDKVGKPRGLVGYLALSDEEDERAGKPPKSVWKHILRPRTILYTVLWSLVGVGLVFALFIRSEIDMTVSAVRNPTYVTLSDGTIRNIYDVRLRNMQGEERQFRFSVTADAAFGLDLEGAEALTVTVPPDSTTLQRVYVSAPPGSGPATSEQTELRLWITDVESTERAWRDTVFNGRVQ